MPINSLFCSRGEDMDKKSLKRIKRKELLEIMLEQAKRIKELEDKLALTTKELENKKITINESGSIAEASLKLNNIFTDAQSAIDQYLDNVKDNCQKMEEEIRKKALEDREKLIEDTLAKCTKKEKVLEEKYKKLLSSANKNSKIVVKVNSVRKNKAKTTKKKESNINKKVKV
mgnify:CR=1 FL=1